MDRKRKLIVAGVAILAAAVTGGAVAATQGTSPRQESQAVVNDAARELGVEPSELSAALRKALANRVDAAVEAGRLSEAAGEMLKARINSGEVPLMVGPGLRHFGHGPGMHFELLETAASYLGLTEAEVRERLNDETTLAQIARAENKSVDGLVDALVKAADEKLDQDVADGKLTQAQADAMREFQRERIADFVNNGRLRFREHRGGPPRPGRGEAPADLPIPVL